MIDFRYHLVSIVSIFLALAVGIVLGAGPLQGQIGTTLTAEITQLRKDKADLRGEVTALNAAAADQDAYESAVAKRVVSGVAAGRSVAVVVLPGARTELVKAVSDTVAQAGGMVGSTSRLDANWASSDATVKAQREDLAKRLASTVEVAATTTTDVAPSLLDRVLAAALVSDNTSIGQDGARAVLSDLVAGKLVDVDAKTAVPAQLVVVVAPDAAADGGKEQQTLFAEWVQLARALDTAAAGSVVVSGGESPGAKLASVVRAVRGDKNAASAISTVDNADQPMGLASTLLALAQQETGVVGHFGLAEGATAPFAPLPGAATP